MVLQCVLEKGSSTWWSASPFHLISYAFVVGRKLNTQLIILKLAVKGLSCVLLPEHLGICSQPDQSCEFWKPWVVQHPLYISSILFSNLSFSFFGEVWWYSSSSLFLLHGIESSLLIPFVFHQSCRQWRSQRTKSEESLSLWSMKAEVKPKFSERKVILAISQNLTLKRQN